MTTRWDDWKPRRPDRYLDWEVANRNSVAAEAETRWCAVLIQVAIGQSNDPALHLRNLRDYILAEQQKRNFLIRIYHNEFELLESAISDVEAGRYRPMGVDDVRFQFFVYLPESQAYAHGDFALLPDYRVRLVGAPVDINLSQKEIKLDRTAFQPLETSSERRVAIGIIDDSIAFAHQRFRTRHGVTGVAGERTRIQAIWLQNQEHPDPTSTDWMAFGKRLMAGDIDLLFEETARANGSIYDTEVYRRAGLLDFGRDDHKSMALRVAHGTHVMDLAGGYEPDDPAGLHRPLLAVQLPASVTADTSGVTMGSYVLQGLRQVMLWADKLDGGRPMPLVVNFSYGILAGPKDGWHILEREIDRLVRHRNKTVPTVVVLPAGNAYRSRTTAKMRLPSGVTNYLDWVVLPDDKTASFVEIWSDGSGSDRNPGQLVVTLSPPDDIARGVVSEPTQARLLTRAGWPIAGLYYDAVKGPTGGLRTRITLAINPTRTLAGVQGSAAAGSWRISVKNTSPRALEVALYVQRDDTPAGYRLKGRQSYFDHPSAYEHDPQTSNYESLVACPITHTGTLSAIGTGKATVLVGGALDSDQVEPAVYASSGPTPGRVGPDFSCVSDQGHAHVGVLAAGTLTGSMVALRGSSVAAPQLARRLADLATDMLALRRQCQAEEQPHPQLGCAFVPAARRGEVPDRRRPGRPADSMT